MSGDQQGTDTWVCNYAWLLLQSLLHNRLMDSCSYVRKNTLLATKGGCISPHLPPTKSATDECSNIHFIVSRSYKTLYIHYSTARRKRISRMIMVCVRDWTTNNKYHTLNLFTVNLHGARSMGLMYTQLQHQSAGPCKFEFVREKGSV